MVSADGENDPDVLHEDYFDGVVAAAEIDLATACVPEPPMQMTRHYLVEIELFQDCEISLDCCSLVFRLVFFLCSVVFHLTLVVPLFVVVFDGET